MELVVGTISLPRELFSLSCSCFRSCGAGTIVYGKLRFELHVYSAVETAWLAQNIRNSSTNVRLHPVAVTCLL